MTIKLNSLKSDTDKEQDGDWIDCPEIGEGVAFKVRSINYPAYQQALNAMLRRLNKTYRGGMTIPPNILDVELGKLYAKYLLLDWKGIDLDYSADLAAASLSDLAYRDLRAAVSSAAAQVGRSHAEYVEETLGNLQPSSAGSSTVETSDPVG